MVYLIRPSAIKNIHANKERKAIRDRLKAMCGIPYTCLAILMVYFSILSADPIMRVSIAERDSLLSIFWMPLII